jgi:hypothetical protein
MSQTFSVLLLSASTRPNRVGPAVADWFRRATRDTAADLHIDLDPVDLGELALPMLDEPAHPSEGDYRHPHTLAWSARVAAADAIVVVTPEYNGGMPAASTPSAATGPAQSGYSPGWAVSCSSPSRITSPSIRPSRWSPVSADGLQPGQVFGDERTDEPSVVAGDQQQPHVDQRHAHPAQPRQQPGRTDLVRAVPPVAAARVDLRRHQQPRPVVEAQRADRQPARASQLPDTQQVPVEHAPNPPPSTSFRVKSRSGSSVMGWRSAAGAAHARTVLVRVEPVGLSHAERPPPH